MTGYGSEIGNDSYHMTVTPRTFATVVGGLLFLAGAVFLLWPQTATWETNVFGDTEIQCGSALIADVSEVGGDLCDDTLKTNRMIGWPLGIVGAVVVAGALFVQSPVRRDGV